MAVSAQTGLWTAVARPFVAPWLVLASSILLSATVAAQQPFETLADPQQQARYQALIQEVRCLTCLNRSIAESDTPLANDLRREIRELIEGGASDEQVAAFLTERYGDFVLYRPPLSPRTVPLWAAPAVFLGIGAIAFAVVLRRRLSQPIGDDEDWVDDEAFEADDAVKAGTDPTEATEKNRQVNS